MKKFFSKVGKGLLKFKETKVKVIVTIILAAVMLVDLNPFFLKAGRETLVYTCHNGTQLAYGFDNNLNVLAYYSICKMGGHVAYCVDYHVKDPPNGSGLPYIKNIKENKAIAVLLNGYPNKSPAQMGVDNADEAYLATQMAIWTAVNGTSDTKGANFYIDKIQPNVKENKDYEKLFKNAKTAAKSLLQKNYEPGNFKLNSSNAKVNYDYSDTQVKIGPFKVQTTGNMSIGKINVNISNATSWIDITDKNNNKKSTFSANEDIYAIVDKKKSGSFTINAKATANESVGVIYGKGSYQNFVFLDTEQKDVSSSANASWEQSKGNIKVVKSDQDNKPVQGAEFTLKDSEGKQVTTGKTDANGNLSFNGLLIGNYTLTETSVPDGYIIKQSTYKVTVKRNETATVKVENTKVKGVLQIIKEEKNTKEPIQGAIFEIYDENGKSVQKITTNENGIATSSELVKGKYTFKEIYVPDNYIMEDKVYDFSITETINSVKKTITNEKIVGSIEILKMTDDSKKPLSGADFIVMNSNKTVVGTVTTDSNGKGVIKNLVKGTYTYKETKAPEGYDKDENEYTFKIEN